MDTVPAGVLPLLERRAVQIWNAMSTERRRDILRSCAREYGDTDQELQDAIRSSVGFISARLAREWLVDLAAMRIVE